MLLDLSPKLARAVEDGKPLRAYRALWWLRFKRDAEPHRALIDSFLERRRLFAQRITSAPTMFTLNLVGTRAYGEDEVDRSDGTYVKTLFFVFLLVPIFAFA